MTSTVPTPLPYGPNQPGKRTRLRYAWRALRTAEFGLIVGAFWSLLRDQNLWYTWIYSLCIALICWLCIDLSRVALARSLWRIRGGDREWPGWPIMAVVVVLGSCAGFTAGTALGDWLTGFHSANLFDATNFREALSLVMIALIPAVGITYFFYSRGALADREASAQTAQRQAAESQLKLLESQLEPHMLFNTLANLRVLIALDPPRAQAMLDQLIAFLRANLGGSRAQQQSLRAEFARLGDYLALIQVRMADRLASRFDLPEELADVAIPPLLLQPLVENSIKHGLETSVQGGRIEVRATRDGADLVLCVRDTGIGFDAEPTIADPDKFGLRQVRERLATLYGSQASLALTRVQDAEGGTLAVIRLPFSP